MRPIKIRLCERAGWSESLLERDRRNKKPAPKQQEKKKEQNEWMNKQETLTANRKIVWFVEGVCGVHGRE